MKYWQVTTGARETYKLLQRFIDILGKISIRYSQNLPRNVLYFFYPMIFYGNDFYKVLCSKKYPRGPDLAKTVYNWRSVGAQFPTMIQRIVVGFRLDFYFKPYSWLSWSGLMEFMKPTETKPQIGWNEVGNSTPAPWHSWVESVMNVD